MARDRKAVTAASLYGVTPLLLSKTFRLPAAMAEDWRDQLRANPSDAAVVARFVKRDLGAFDPAWDGWLCKDGLLWPREGLPADPGQVIAVPFVREQLREYERAQRWMLDRSMEGRRRELVIDEATRHLERAIEALRQR